MVIKKIINELMYRCAPSSEKYLHKEMMCYYFTIYIRYFAGLYIRQIHNTIGEDFMESLTKDTFMEKIFNYEENDEWKYEGELPCIIDFYADWCGPCKMVEPVLEEISQEYEGKLTIYRIDTDAEQELAGIFGIQSIPSILFVPVEDQPQMAVGALPKDAIKKAITSIFNIE